MQVFSNSRLAPFAILLIFIAGAIFAVKYFPKNVDQGESPSPETPGASEGVLVDKSLFTERTYRERHDYAVFDVRYPQFKNVSLKANSDIENLIMQGVSWHKEASEETWRARYETQLPGDDVSSLPSENEKYPLSINWTPVQVNSKFVSVLFIMAGYTGGAHGYENMASFNYDIIGKKEVQLADLFPGDKNYLTTISLLVKEDLKTQISKTLGLGEEEGQQMFESSILPMLALGTEPNLENFSIFTFTPEIINFYFPQYQVAPYALGSFLVSIPR